MDVLDYEENEAGLVWVWLENGSQHAYLIYPDTVTGESFSFPDGTNMLIMSNRVNLSLLGESNQQVSLTRFGGEIIVEGETITLSYTQEEFVAGEQGNEYRLNSQGEMDVLFQASFVTTESDIEITGELNIATSGNIRSIEATESIDALYAPNTDNNWSIFGFSSGEMTINNNNLSPIVYASIENLVGGSGNDSFELSSGGYLLGQIDGGAGINSLIGQTSNEWIITAPLNLCGNSNPDQSSLTRSSGTQQISSEAGNISTPCFNDSNLIFADLPQSILVPSFQILGLENITATEEQTTTKRNKKSWAGSYSHLSFLLLLPFLLILRFNNHRSRSIRTSGLSPFGRHSNNLNI